MNITEISIKRPILIIVVFIFLSVLGLFSYSKLTYELLPDITPPMITVMTIYPGASPNEVESSVTKILEDVVTSVENIKKVTASSFESISFVMIEFNQNADESEALQEVLRRVNEVSADLPVDAEKSVVSKFSMTEFPSLVMAATSSLENKEFYRFMEEEIKPRISRLEGVGIMTLVGGEQREIKINVDRNKLVKYDLSMLEIVQIIRQSNFDFPAGQVKDKEGQYNVRITGKFSSLDEINNLVVKDIPGEGKIKIRNVAEVKDGIKEITTIARLNNKNALGVLIQRQSGANTVEVCSLVKNELKAITNEYSDINLKFDIAQDESVFTLQSAEAVNNDLMFAIFLVGIVMLVFLHSLRNSLIVMVAIPASIVSTFIAMYVFGFTLNMMSLLGLSLVIGILVDDSIVVLENIYRHLEMGIEKRLAALVGRNEIGFTALSITLVDVVVFLPLALLDGVVGNMMRQFAGVIVVATLLSLFVSFTITPMLASRFSKLEVLTKDSFLGKLGFLLDDLFRKLSNIYLRILTLALNYKTSVIVITTLLLFSAFALLPLGFIGGEFISPSDKGEVSVVLELEPGAKLTRTSQVAKQVEHILLKRPEVITVFSNIGSSQEGFIGAVSNNIAELKVTLVPKEERGESIQDLCKTYKDLARQIPGVKVRVAPMTMFGTSDMSPVAVGISGSNYDEVVKTADIIEKIVKATPGTSDVKKSTEEGKPELHIEINREKMAALGLTLDYVGSELRVAINGDNNSKFPDGQSEYDINIQYDEFDRNNPAELENFTFVNMYGQQIYLKQFADVVYTSGPSKLERKYRNSSVTVMSMVVGRPSGDIGEDIKAEIDKLDLPRSIKITYENDLEMQDESFGSLGIAFLIAILFVYLILAALYNSFIYPLTVLLTIPLAIIGALYSLALTLNSLNITTILGMIMLVGLVGKNAILLVDRTNQNREEGKSVIDAIMEAAKTRLRPILMTTLTMVFGVIPIAISSGASNEMKHGLAFVLIGGLTSSLFLTLLLIPVMYIKIEQLRNWITNLVSKFSSPKLKETAAASVVKTVILFVLLAASIGTVNSQTIELTMNHAVEIGLTNNNSIHIAKLQAERSREDVKQSWGNLLPEISAEGTYVRNTKLPVLFLPSEFFGITGGGNVPLTISEKNVYEGYLQFTMPLYNAAIYPGIRAAEANQKAMQENVILSKEEIATEIKKTYLGILAAEEQLKLVNKSIVRANQRLNDVKALYRQGLAADVDTLTAYLGVESLRPVRLKVTNNINNAKSGLKYLLGLEHDAMVILNDSLSCFDISVSDQFSNAYETALTNRPELNILQYQLEAADELKSVSLAEFLPSLNVFGHLKIESEAPDYRFSNYPWPTSSLVGLQLSIPIFSGFKSKVKYEQAEIDWRTAQKSLDDLKNSLNTEVEIAVSKILEAKENIGLQQSNVILAKRNYERIQSRFRNGVSKLSDLLDAELSLRQTQTDKIMEQYNYAVACAEYERTTGTVLADK